MSTPDAGGPADDGRFKAMVTAARERAKAEQGRFTAILDKHKHQPLVDVALGTYRRDREIAGTVVGSALAFRLFLFFVPLLLLVVGLAGFLASWVDADDVADHAGVSGGLADQIRSAFDQPGSTRWAAVLLGLVGIVSTGRTLSKVMVASSSLAWRLPATTKASLKVLGGLVGLIAGIGLVAALMNRVRIEFGLGVTGVSFLAVLAACPARPAPQVGPGEAVLRPRRATPARDVTLKVSANLGTCLAAMAAAVVTTLGVWSRNPPHRRRHRCRQQRTQLTPRRGSRQPPHRGRPT